LEKIRVWVKFGSDKSDNVKIRTRNWWPIPDFFPNRTIRTTLNLDSDNRNMKNVMSIFKIWTENSCPYPVFPGRTNLDIWIRQIFASANCISIACICMFRFAFKVRCIFQKKKKTYEFLHDLVHLISQMCTTYSISINSVWMNLFYVQLTVSLPSLVLEIHFLIFVAEHAWNRNYEKASYWKMEIKCHVR